MDYLFPLYRPLLTMPIAVEKMRKKMNKRGPRMPHLATPQYSVRGGGKSGRQAASTNIWIGKVYMREREGGDFTLFKWENFRF